MEETAEPIHALLLSLAVAVQGLAGGSKGRRQLQEEAAKHKREAAQEQRRLKDEAAERKRQATLEAAKQKRLVTLEAAETKRLERLKAGGSHRELQVHIMTVCELHFAGLQCSNERGLQAAG